MVEPFITRIAADHCYHPSLRQVNIPHLSSYPGLCSKLPARDTFPCLYMVDREGEAKAEIDRTTDACGKPTALMPHWDNVVGTSNIPTEHGGAGIPLSHDRVQNGRRQTQGQRRPVFLTDRSNFSHFLCYESRTELIKEYSITLNLIILIWAFAVSSQLLRVCSIT